jgi:hypothetical protein
MHVSGVSETHVSFNLFWRERRLHVRYSFTAGYSRLLLYCTISIFDCLFSVTRVIQFVLAGNKGACACTGDIRSRQAIRDYCCTVP